MTPKNVSSHGKHQVCFTTTDDLQGMGFGEKSHIVLYGNNTICTYIYYIKGILATPPKLPPPKK